MRRHPDDEINLIRRNNIEKLRAKHGLNKKQLGDKIGIQGSTVSNMLLGRQGCSEKTCEAIYKAFPELPENSLNIDTREDAQEDDDSSTRMTVSESVMVTFNFPRPVAIHVPINEARALLISLLG